LGPKVLKLSAERSAAVRKLFRLVQLEQVAERIVQEGLVPSAGDELDPDSGERQRFSSAHNDTVTERQRRVTIRVPPWIW
jgi:hypothetical protein